VALALNVQSKLSGAYWFNELFASLSGTGYSPLLNQALSATK
jgi:hypothetical protein